MTYEELYNKYLQILKIEDEDEYDQKLKDLDSELYDFVVQKYPELQDLIEDYYLIDFMDVYTKERPFIQRIIKGHMDDDHIIFHLCNIDKDKVIEKYIDKNIL